MEVRYYSVISVGAGWAICEDHLHLAACYATRCEAVDAARHLAIDHWRRTGETAAVRMVRSGDSSGWIDDIAFGDRSR